MPTTIWWSEKQFEGWDAMAKANHKRNIYGMGPNSLCVVTSDAYASDSMSGAHRQAAMW